MSGFMYLEQKGLMLKREAQYMNERLPQVVASLQNRCGGKVLSTDYADCICSHPYTRRFKTLTFPNFQRKNLLLLSVVRRAGALFIPIEISHQKLRHSLQPSCYYYIKETPLCLDLKP